MHKLLKFSGVLAILTASIGEASAFSSSVYPVSLSGTPEDVIISYTSASSFSLSGLSLALGNPGGANNILASTPGALQPYTTLGGQTIAAGSGSLSEVITAPAGSYTFSFNTTADTLHLTVSAVPLPAGFPLFAMAMLGLGMLGYYKSRTNSHAVAA